MANLARGSRGDAVKNLQMALNSRGYGPLDVDGIFGAQTEEAVKQLQTSANITVDGIVGPETSAVLTAHSTPVTDGTHAAVVAAAVGSGGPSKLAIGGGLLALGGVVAWWRGRRSR